MCLIRSRSNDFEIDQSRSNDLSFCLATQENIWLSKITLLLLQQRIFLCERGIFCSEKNRIPPPFPDLSKLLAKSREEGGKPVITLAGLLSDLLWQRALPLVVLIGL